MQVPVPFDSKGYKKMKSKMKLLVLFYTLLLTGTAQSGPILDTPILGGELLVASNGNVYAEFLGSDAGYFNTLYLGNDEIFDKSSPVNGDLVDLGIFSAGTELEFWIYVDNTELSFFSGDSSRNPDGLAHAQATTSLLNDVYVTMVGFEDLLGGGDLDYNDFMFSLTNVIDPPTQPAPEPPVLFLLAFGMVGLVLQRLLLSRRRARLSAILSSTRS